MSTKIKQYTRVAISLHWIIAVLMIVMLFFGEDMIRGATGTFYPSLHASLGLSILILSLVRVWWRINHAPPAQPASLKRWETRLSGATHFMFYVLMIALPLSGLLSFGHEVHREAVLTGTTLFGLVGVPILPDIGNGASNFHELGGKLGQVLVLLHVAAAFKHQFWDKDNLLRRMSPH
jgi:cytochrome b561